MREILTVEDFINDKTLNNKEKYTESMDKLFNALKA